MIVCVAWVVKIALLVLAILSGVWFLKKSVRTQKGRLYICTVVAVLFFAVLAQAVSMLIPPLTDEITLTALGEKSEAAQTDEVFLQDFTIDGEAVPVEAPVEGKWFWFGDMLCWRNESDARRPDDLTRSVTLKVPVGWSRTANFKSSYWRGLVEIQTESGSQVFDTYWENETVSSAELGRSGTSRLVLNQIRYLAVYAVVLAVLCGAMLWGVTWFTAQPGRLKKHGGKLIYGGIAVVTFGFMAAFAGNISFWIDELGQISWVSGTVWEAIKICLTTIDATPPLPSIIFSVWYDIAPYGQRWLLLASMVPCAIGIYVLGLAGERLKDTYTGVLASAFCAASTAVWNLQAYEFRAYPYMLLFVSLALYCFIRRNQEGGKWHAFYSAALLGLGMSHYFGMMACAGFFLADVFLLWKRKIHWKTGFDYAVPGGICLVWVTAVILMDNGRITGLDFGWQSHPSIKTFYELLHSLSGNTEAAFWLLIFGLCLGILGAFIPKKRDFDWHRFYLAFFAWMVTLVILAVAIYGTVINPESPMWMDRYFMVLAPFCFLLMGDGVTYLLDLIRNDDTLLKSAVCMVLSGTLFLSCLVTMSQARSSEPYREAADWLYTEINYIFNDNTVIVSRDGNSATLGWQEYYIARKGQRDALNVRSSSISKDELLNYDRVYVQYCRTGLGGRLLEMLNENYDLESDNTAVKVRVYTRK